MIVTYRNPTVVLIVVLLTVATTLAVVMPMIRDEPGDQNVYTVAANRLTEGARIYRPEEIMAFTYPPFFALPFVPLAPLSEPVRRGVWYFLNVSMLGTLILLVKRHAWPKDWKPAGHMGPPFWVAATLIAVLSGRFLISPVEYQGHDLVVFLLAALAIRAWSKESNRQAGFWAGLGAACKATPLLFLPIFVLQRRFAAAAVFLLTMVAATLLPDLLYPTADGGLWVTSWYQNFVAKVEVGAAANADGAWTAWNLLNQSLAGTLYRLATPVVERMPFVFDVSLFQLNRTTLKAATIIAQLAVIGFLVFVTLPARSRALSGQDRSFQRLGEGSAVLCAMLLLAPMSSKQHFCTLLVPISFCVIDVFYRRRDPIVIGSLLVVFLFGTLGTKDLIGQSLGNRLLAYGSLTLCASACLLATGHVLLCRSRSLSVAKLASEQADELGPSADNRHHTEAA